MVDLVVGEQELHWFRWRHLAAVFAALIGVVGIILAIYNG